LNKENGKKKFTSKSIFIVWLVGFSILLVGFLIPMVNADHDTVEKSLNVELNEISFRDISNTNPQTSSLDVDSSTSKSGFVTVTVSDPDANLDLDNIDAVTAFAAIISLSGETRTTPINLPESGFNSGIFTSTVNLVLSSATGNQVEVQRGETLSFSYLPEPDNVGRLFAEINVASTPGTVEISDFLISNPARVSCSVTLVTQPVLVDITDADVDNITVTMSYANVPPSPPRPSTATAVFFKLLSAPVPANEEVVISFESLTPLQPNPNLAPFLPLDISGHNFDQKTITNINPVPVGDRLYAIGYSDPGCPGGGGGGLISPGLVVNALAGVASISALFSGGSGDGPNAPTVLSGSVLSLEGTEFFDLFEVYDSLEGIEGILSDTNKNSFDSTQTVNTGEPLTFIFDLYENGGKNNLEHATLYMNIRGDETDVDSSDTYILFDRGQSTHIIDPHGFIENANFEILEKTPWDLVLKYDITFAKPMDTSHIIIQSWDLDRHSSTKIFENALQVVDPNTILVAEEIIPEPEIQQFTSENVPIWVKNNAGWWSEELIDDSDFIAGIEYLIQNKIIIILDDQVVTSSETSYQTPQWIKNNAGWWSEDLITEQEFIDGLQWLISNGIIQVTET